jgi:hypothetical protein
MLWQEGFFICPSEQDFLFIHGQSIELEFGCLPPNLSAALAAGVLE